MKPQTQKHTTYLPRLVDEFNFPIAKARGGATIDRDDACIQAHYMRAVKGEGFPALCVTHHDGRCEVEYLNGRPDFTIGA